MNFAVWTMQRTGGTSFASLLAAWHPAPTLHEPFLYGREFSDIRRTFDRTGELGGQDRIAACNFKHTYDLAPWAINAALIEFLRREKYFQILLLRRDEAARMRSRALASLTRAYGPRTAREKYPAIASGDVALPSINIREQMRYLGHCELATRRLRSIFERENWLVVVYEDFFAGSPSEIESRLAVVVDAWRKAGVDLRQPKHPDEIRRRYIDRGRQGSEAMFGHVPNMRTFDLILRARLAWSRFRFGE